MKNMKGQSLIELLLAIGLTTIILPAILTGLVASRSGRAQQNQRLEAVGLLKEAQEAVRNVREKDWNTFAVNGTFHPKISGSEWILTNVPAGPETINGFTRQVVISDVNRGTCPGISCGAIVLTGGTLDPSTKKIVTTVSWSTPITSLVTSTSYIARLDNLAHTETTLTDFNAGTSTNVKPQATNPPQVADDGEIVLSQTGGYGDWCNPAPTPAAQLDLSHQGIPNAVSASLGSGNVIAAAAEGGNASGVTYAGITISDPAYPTNPVPSVSGTFSNTPKIKTSGVFNDASYGYLATDQHSKSEQGIIVDLSNYTKVGTLDLNSNANGQSIFVANNTAYLTVDDGYLYTFNVTAKSGSHSYLGRRQLAGVGNKVIVVGSNAYIAVNSSTAQLQIVDVTNPNNPGTPISINVGNGQGATDVFVNQTQLRAYLVTSYASTQPDFFTIDIKPTDAWYKQVVNTFNTDGMSPKGVVAVSGARAIIVGTGGTKQYQIIGISNENVPPPSLTTCGPGLPISSGVNGIATLYTAANRAYSYIITGDSGAELKIYEGGPGAGNGNYAPSGTFISQPFGPIALPTTFNRFISDISQPVAGDVQLQLGVADAVGGSCTDVSKYTFVGTENGVTGTGKYFTSSVPGVTTISGPVPLGSYSPYYQNPGKCFRYKVILNTADSTLTPVFKDITVNYSP